VRDGPVPALKTVITGDMDRVATYLPAQPSSAR
jgi:hypothetical protein